MKKLLYYIIAIVMLMLPVTSCDDVLDKQSVDSFNEQVVFSDINVVKAYLGKCYDRMGGNTNAGILGMREDLCHPRPIRHSVSTGLPTMST